MDGENLQGRVLVVTRDRQFLERLRESLPLAGLQLHEAMEPSAFAASHPVLREIEMFVAGIADLRALQRRRQLPGLPAGSRLVVAASLEQLPTVPSFLDRAGLLPLLAGCLVTGRTKEEMAASLRLAAAGYLSMPPGLLAPLLDRDVQAARLAALSERERELLLQLREGLSNREIAARSGSSERRVKSRVRALLDKLGCRGRTAAAVLACRLEEVAPEAGAAPDSPEAEVGSEPLPSPSSQDGARRS